MTTSNAIRSIFDLKTQEGAAAACRAVLDYLGPDWKCRAIGRLGNFSVHQPDAEQFLQISITNEINGSGRYTAWIDALGYQESRSAEDPVQAVKDAQEALRKRAADLQNLYLQIASHSNSVTLGG